MALTKVNCKTAKTSEVNLLCEFRGFFLTEFQTTRFNTFSPPVENLFRCDISERTMSIDVFNKLSTISRGLSFLQLQYTNVFSNKVCSLFYHFIILAEVLHQIMTSFSNETCFD